MNEHAIIDTDDLLALQREFDRDGPPAPESEEAYQRINSSPNGRPAFVIVDEDTIQAGFFDDRENAESQADADQTVERVWREV